MIRRLRRIVRTWRGESGVTLVEAIMAVGLMTMAVTMVGAPMFSVIQVDQDWRDDLSATANWRQASGYFSRDATKASTLTIDAADAERMGLSISWTSGSEEHNVVYALQDGTLLRTYDGVSGGIARGVTGVQFSRSDRLLTMVLEVEAGQGATETAEARASLLELAQ